MNAVYGWATFGSWVAWAAWSAATGPQNPAGWLFFLTLPLTAPAVGWGAARLLDRRASRHRI